MNILRDAVTAVNRRETGVGLPERVVNVLQQLANTRNIDEDARADIISIMDDSVELASAMVNHTYPVELILRRVTNILATSQRILMHTESFRPGRLAFGAMLPNGELLDLVASTQEEAISQLQRLQAFGVPRNAVVVPIRVSSQYVMQPQVSRQPQLAPVPMDHGPQPTTPPFIPQKNNLDMQAPRDYDAGRAQQIRDEIDAIAAQEKYDIEHAKEWTGDKTTEPAPLPSTLK